MNLFQRKIRLIRNLSGDDDYIERVQDPAALVAAWARQVILEFNDAPAVQSALLLDPEVTLKVVQGRVEATFTGWLFFDHDALPDLGEPITNDADLIQRIFYDEGGAGGGFELLDDLSPIEALREYVSALKDEEQ